jgi:hypothetical protein
VAAEANILEAGTTTAIVLAVVAVAAEAEVAPDRQHQEVSSPTASGIVIARHAYLPSISK